MLVRSILIDTLAVLCVYTTPALTHLFSFPVYYLEPMRVMLILAILYSSRPNAILVALTLPVFSLLISSHPLFFKMVPMTIELVLNVVFFIYLTKKLPNLFFAVALSILASKTVYYLLKYIFILAGLLRMEVFSTPWFYQLAMIVFLSVFSAWVMKKKRTA